MCHSPHLPKTLEPRGCAVEGPGWGAFSSDLHDPTFSDPIRQPQKGTTVKGFLQDLGVRANGKAHRCISALAGGAVV